MAEADAWSAPERSTFFRLRAQRENVFASGARMITSTRYRRMLIAETVFKRAIPPLIIIFLIVIAGVRFMSLMEARDTVERDAKTMLSLAAGELSSAMVLADRSGTSAPGLIDKVGLNDFLSKDHVLALTDASFKVVDLSADTMDWTGKRLDGILSGGQPLFLFGGRAGVMKVTIGGEKWYAAVDLSSSRSGAAAALVSQDAVFADWTKSVQLNVSLFVLTAVVLLIVLYAYFGQVARAQAADQTYCDHNQRIDLALVRGRCGLWDWDMVRGKMYWSRSMYEMLGYEPCESMLSFGVVAEIIHVEDGNLFELANRVSSREIDNIDQVFRMRHSDGHWVWMRARAQVIDPEAPEIQMIGIALDVTEQRHLALRSEAADLRLRTAIENINESFVLWDSAQQLVMCNTKYQLDNGLGDRDVVPGASRASLEERMVAFASERRLPNANGPKGGATYERQLADGRWLQVNELKTRDGGIVSSVPTSRRSSSIRTSWSKANAG